MMPPRELAEWLLGLNPSQVMHVLALRAYDAKLADGRGVHDAIDFKQWFLELAEELKKHGD